MMRFLYLFVNLLFVIKYSLRVSAWFAAGSVVCYLLFAFFLMYGTAFFKKLNGRLLTILFSVLLIALAFGQSLIDPYSLQVDRWSAIHHFIAKLFQGEYPYGAMTHLGGYGSPFPVWQLLHVPFYLLGNVALSFLPAVILFLWTVYKLYDRQVCQQVFIFLFCSPAFLYEVMVRSDLMVNFLFCLSMVHLLIIYKIRISGHFWLVAFLCGLMMSTRLSAVIPLGIWLLKDYLMLPVGKKVYFPLAVAGIFILTILPFVFWSSSLLDFSDHNPFVLQSRQGHLSDFIWMVPLFLLMALSWKNTREYHMRTSLFLFLLVCGIFAHNMIARNNWNMLFEATYDITYFNMSLPFTIMALAVADSSPSCKWLKG